MYISTYDFVPFTQAMASACTTHPFSLPDLNSDPNPIDFIDFEFHPSHSDTMLSADKLFFAGRLLPLHPSDPVPADALETLSKPITKLDLNGPGLDFNVTPKAATCTTRWSDLLRLKQLNQSAKSDPRPGKLHFPPRHSQASDPNLFQPLLKESNPEHGTFPSRLSLSSTSSSGRVSDSDEPHLPRLSLGSDPVPVYRNRASGMRLNALADSPRMNASGKVVFNGLGRSASSPSMCGERAKAQCKVERSYSGNVRGTRVLNVPICSFRAGSKSFGFGHIFNCSSSSISGSSKK